MLEVCRLDAEQTQLYWPKTFFQKVANVLRVESFEISMMQQCIKSSFRTNLF